MKDSEPLLRQTRRRRLDDQHFFKPREVHRGPHRNLVIRAAAALRERTAPLMEIHGQHDDRALADPASHRAILDAFGGLQSQLAKVAAASRAVPLMPAEGVKGNPPAAMWTGSCLGRCDVADSCKSFKALYGL